MELIIVVTDLHLENNIVFPQAIRMEQKLKIND